MANAMGVPIAVVFPVETCKNHFPLGLRRRRESRKRAVSFSSGEFCKTGRRRLQSETLEETRIGDLGEAEGQPDEPMTHWGSWILRTRAT